MIIRDKWYCTMDESSKLGDRHLYVFFSRITFVPNGLANFKWSKNISRYTTNPHQIYINTEILLVCWYRLLIFILRICNNLILPYYFRWTFPTGLALVQLKIFRRFIHRSLPTCPWIDSFTPWTFSHHCSISLSSAFVQTSTRQRKLSIPFTKHFDIFPRARKSLKFLDDRPKTNKISNESKCIICFFLETENYFEHIVSRVWNRFRSLVRRIGWPFSYPTSGLQNRIWWIVDRTAETRHYPPIPNDPCPRQHGGHS